MSDQKYRQRGYQDSGRPDSRNSSPRTPRAPIDPRLPRDPKVMNMMAFTEVFRCARCGAIEAGAIGALSTCAKCGVDLHACIQCQSFDPGARFECRETIAARVRPKDARNDCSKFVATTRVEKETGSTTTTTPESSARKAFDDLFK
jgi:hypothetical protein